MPFIVAIDEAGRGPLAGPIAVAALAATARPKILKNIRDSKKLSAKQRIEWLEKLENNFEYKVVMVGPQIIDRIGINRATRLAVARVLNQLSRSHLNRSLDRKRPSMILLDGLLKAPKHYNQQTIIKGDEKVPLISAASVVAKVYRDRKMFRLHKIFPQYGFDWHKGYGTKFHYQMIKKNGISIQHRVSFLKNIRWKRAEL